MNTVMEYAAKLKQFPAPPSQKQVADAVEQARRSASVNYTTDVYKLCYSCIDLTSLETTDNNDKISEFARKTVNFMSEFPGLPNVASICVYPNFVETVGLQTGDSGMRITSVAGGFPSSQTFLEVKMLEAAMAVENGADEVDIVIGVGSVLAGEWDIAGNDIEMMRQELDGDTVLKVIIESGALQTPELIYNASMLAMLAGADFVKTSTGKIPVSATPEAAVAMCAAIRDFHEKTGKKIGFKAAGGVRTPEDAALYYTIVETILGRDWLTPELFRIGASSAANNLLCAMTGKEVKYY